MRLGIVGAGCLGGVLARRWAEVGHEVYLGARGAEGESQLPSSRRIRVVSPYDAAGADVVVLAVPGEAAPTALVALGDLEGRVVIDCTNIDEPIQPSLAAQLSECALNGRLVKALNTVDARMLLAPQPPAIRPAAPLCGDCDDACDIVSELVRELGLTPLRFGDLRAALALEALGRVGARMHHTGGALALTLVDLQGEDEPLAARRQTRDYTRPVR